MCSSDIFLGLLAILFPPIAVWIKSGICTADSLINILLCTLGYIPGLLHAWYIISLYPEPDDDDGDGYNNGYHVVPPSDQGESGGGGGGRRGRVTYYYVNHQPSSEGLRQQGQRGYVAGPQQQRGYGTVPSQQEGQQRAGGESAQGGVPPSYEQAIQGDNKVQR